MTIVAAAMSASYLTVAYSNDRSWQLLGVAFAAFQGGLGEASCLALCSLYDSRRTLTLWSSGTGFAGIEKRHDSSLPLCFADTSVAFAVSAA